MGSGGANMGIIIIGEYWDCLGLLIRIRSPTSIFTSKSRVCLRVNFSKSSCKSVLRL